MINASLKGALLYRLLQTVLWATFLCYYRVASSVQPSRLLQLEEFSIRAKVSTIRDRHLNGYEEEFKVSEHYSNTGASARLEIRDLDDTSETVAYQYVSNGKQLIRLSKGKDLQVECELGDSKRLIDDLFGSIVSFDGRITVSDWTVSRDHVPEYVIGLARLLLIVDASKDMMQLDTTGSKEIRNIKMLSYRFNTDLGRKGSEMQNTMMVYYADTTYIQSSPDVTLDLPLEIRLLLPGGAEICVDFTLVGHVPKGSLGVESDDSNLFIPVGIGCASKLLPSTLFVGQTAPRVATFRAELRKTPDWRHLGDYFIAYDGFIEALRVDTMNNHGRDVKHSITIYEMRANRKYHVLQEVEGNADNLSENLNSPRSDDRSQCVAAKIRVDDSAGNLFDPFFPFDQMVELGTTTVRGIDARVFEHNTTKLPAFLFPQISFLDIEGTPRLLYSISYGTLKGETQDYSVVYYFSKAINSDPTSASPGNLATIGPLLRIDFLRRGRTFATAEIFDFVWQLADAPNGDRQDELFSTRDRCSGVGTQLDRYAVMSLSLKGNESSEVRKPEVDSLMAYMTLRNKALLRSLVLKTNLKVSQLYDLESKVHTKNHELQVKVALKVHNQKYEVYEAVTVATAQLRKRKAPLSTLSFEECFWEAAHRRKRHYLLFSFCLNSCWIDDEVSRGSLESELFHIRPGANLSCQVMRLDESQPDLVSSNKFWPGLYGSLHSVQLPLQIRDTELLFNVEQVELKNEKNQPVEIDAKSDQHSDLYDDPILNGLALMEDRSIKVAPELPGASVNLNLCQSSCLANMSCSSFSICVTGERIECLNSNLSFKDTGLVKLIKTKVNSLKTSNRSGYISVERQSTSDNNSNDQKIELRVDPRCRIYNKYALEMFSAGPMLHVTVSKHKMTPVESAEKCAALCLRTNLKFLKRLAKLKSNLVSRKEISIQEYWAQSLEYLNRNVSSWCETIKFRDLHNPPLNESVRNQLDLELLTKAGLCTYSGPSWIRKAEQKASGDGAKKNPPAKSEELTMIRMQRYNLIYTLLYERQYGIQLLPLNYQEESVVNGNHQAVSEKSEVDECARLCFSQTIGLKPWCKSFEWVQDATSDSSKTRSYCIFNSITAAEAYLSPRPEQLITNKVTSGVKIWHFEPKSSFSFDQLVLQQLLKSADLKQSNSELRLQSFGVIIVLLLSLITGLFLGHRLGMRLSQQFSDRRESVSNPSRSFLSGLVGSEHNGHSPELSYKRFETELYLPELPELPQMSPEGGGDKYDTD